MNAKAWYNLTADEQEKARAAMFTKASKKTIEAHKAPRMCISCRKQAVYVHYKVEGFVPFIAVYAECSNCGDRSRLFAYGKMTIFNEEEAVNRVVKEIAI